MISYNYPMTKCFHVLLGVYTEPRGSKPDIENSLAAEEIDPINEMTGRHFTVILLGLC